MTAFFSVVNTIGRTISSDDYKIVVEKSTVPVGTAVEVTRILKSYGANFSVVSMPEFLAEGSAIHDLTNPSRVVIGTDDDKAFAVIS
jgi:UDPglucose 6-dehydrogenase